MTIDVHPVADLFPMMAADELAELAADIKARGLLHPVVLDSEGRVLDGRNRLAACELAGIEPEFAAYEGDDPAGYALACNIQRRSLTKGQAAMIAAKAGLFVSNTTGDPAARGDGSLPARPGHRDTQAWLGETDIPVKMGDSVSFVGKLPYPRYGEQKVLPQVRNA